MLLNQDQDLLADLSVAICSSYYCGLLLSTESDVVVIDRKWRTGICRCQLKPFTKPLSRQTLPSSFEFLTSLNIWWRSPRHCHAKHFNGFGEDVLDDRYDACRWSRFVFSNVVKINICPLKWMPHYKSLTWDWIWNKFEFDREGGMWN